MDWVLTAPAALLYATAGLALVAAGLAWSRRSTPGGGLLSLLMFAVAAWALAAGLEAAFVPLARKILFSKLEYVGSGTTATLFLLFASRYSRRDRWLRGWRRIAIWIAPLVSLALVATNELHHSVWTAFLSGPIGSNAVIYVHGLGFHLIIAQIYLYVLAGAALLVLSALRPVVVRRRQAIIILAGALFPLAAGILYSLGDSLIQGLNLVPVSFLFTGLIFVVAMGLSNLFDLVPVARDVLIEKMSDAVLVLDAGRRIVDMNPAAERLLSLDPSSIGQRADRTLAIWRQIHLQTGCENEGHVELPLSDDPLQYVDVRVSPLGPAGRSPAGCLVVFRDITQRHIAEVSLQEANQRLGSQLERIELLQRELREQAIRDALTGLFNRRYLDEVLPRELARAHHDGQTLCAILFDIDHFKQTNDRHGHEEGDRLLTTLGSVFRERTRPGDIACRYGGEEFILILPNTSLSVAEMRSEEVRRTFVMLSQRELETDVVTLSAGIAVFPWHGQTQDSLIRAADVALYAAKEAGRNRTITLPKPDSVQPP